MIKFAGVVPAAALIAVSAFAENPARRICTWAILGPFSQEQDRQLGARELNPTNLQPEMGEVVGGRTWRYFDDRYYCRNQDDYNDLYTYFLEGRPEGPGGGSAVAVAYCGTYVWSPSNQVVTLRFQARDRGSVWVNDSIVLEQVENGRALRDLSSVPIELRAGWNRLLVKAVNDRRIWGFYCNLTDEAGVPIPGLEYSPDVPDVATLKVVTPALPDGYNDQPYIWLDVRNPGGKFSADNPSASPFRFLARGGQPPYTWDVSGLPKGLVLNRDEGEIRGRTEEQGNHTLHLSVLDSAVPPNQVSVERTLKIKPRPTERWWESGSRLGSLRHHAGRDDTHWAFDHLEEQIDFLTRQGYDWQAYTAFSAWYRDDEGTMVSPYPPEMLAYRDGLRAAGIRFGQYMNFFDYRDTVSSAAEHAENMHEAIEFFMRRNEPALWWFDLSIERYGEAVEFDALYSLIRTLDPNCLITVNNDVRARDYECGDLDIVQVHGSFQMDSYWGHWPPSPRLGNNPKFLPVDSWKLPWKGHMDPGEWCKVIVTMLAEPANLEAPRSVDIDTTTVLEADYNMVELHRGIADWLGPRKESILGTMPLDIPVVDWGYIVRQPRTGDIFLHILRNPLGKRGLAERRYIDIAPIAGEVTSVTRFPNGKPIPFTWEDGRLSVDMKDVHLDPVDTIVRVTTQ